MTSSRRALLLGSLLAITGCYSPTQEDPPLPDFVVLFSGASFELDPKARRIVAAAVATANASPDQGISVEGYADPSATPQSNQILSRLRAQSVAEALVRAGVEKSRIRVRHKQAIGGDPGFESRRVEIVIGR